MAAVRQGSRWLHEPPTEEQVREWFLKQTLHDGMEHEPYIGGIVVIGATEKVKVTRTKANDDTFVKEVEQAVFTPYVKVDTRIAYFWDLVRTMNEADDDEHFYGDIAPVEQRRVLEPDSAFFNGHLPEGYFIYAVRNRDDSVSRYVGCVQRVAIYERESYSKMLKGEPTRSVLAGTGTKQTTQTRQWADDNALMKAETGAVGRALGMAGILVVGTGVATAEDMQEAQAGNAGGAAAGSPGPGLPPVVNREGEQIEGEQPGAQPPADQVPSDRPQEPQSPQEEDAALRERALELQKALEGAHPEAWEAYKAWWRERGFGSLNTLSGPALKGALVKLERDLDAARQAAEAAQAAAEKPGD